MSPHRRPQIRVAVVGGGVAGLAAAHTLQGLAEVSLFEAAGRFGGDAHTLDVTLPGASGAPVTFTVDTGVLVFNEHTSPNLLALLARQDLAPTEADASFFVRGGALAWGGPDLGRALSPRRQLMSPRFWRLLADLPRWQRLCAALAPALDTPDDALLAPLDGFLRARYFSAEFRDAYLLPLCSGFSGRPAHALLQAPAAAALRLWHHHGLPTLGGASPWRGVAGGTRRVVQALLAELADARLSTPVRQLARDGQGLRLVTDTQVERFDAVVLACHPDQALRLLGAAASEQERAVLGAFRFEPERVVLHTDPTVLPAARGDWAAWNVAPAAGPAPASLHVWLNRVQPLPVEQPVLLSRNPGEPIAGDRVLGQWALERPVFDLAALRAQARLPALQGQGHTWYAGAWCGNGLFEDGLKAGLHAARALIDRFALVPRLSERGALRQALPGVLA
ncbi:MULTISPECIES: FAD-dependent oxidoreductase [unclassified Hydrogenophaga]|uniref:NAD(P)/FAD-dependent oxidoreductase n=1 Tax=unclassified Hydrogenophaga TaxID=2610897 RepID=UPI00257D6BFE|nr:MULTISPECIES: FAD-dependent oxidoreductase [unclassified Hydrogenophaga]